MDASGFHQRESAKEELDRDRAQGQSSETIREGEMSGAGKSIIVEKRMGNVPRASLQQHLSLKKKACIVKIDNCHYTIVANTPDTESGKSRQSSRNSVTGLKDRTKREKSVHDNEQCRMKSDGSRDTGKKLLASSCFISSNCEMEMAFKKLKDLHSRVTRGSTIGVEDLKKTLEFAISVADRTYFVQQSSAELNHDHVFESDSVPCQVRDWLTMTFTRSLTLGGREEGEKTRFKSVATAIRAGISVERLLKMSSPKTEVPKVVRQHLRKIDEWSFDILDLNEAASKSHGFRHVVRTVMSKYEIPSKFKITNSCFDSFLIMVEEGYKKFTNPYHNDLHAGDVTQTVNCIISQTDLKNSLSDLEIFSVIFAAIIHDFEHTGTTNTFHINVQSDLAMLYNDRAVLENHHVSQVFRRMKEDKAVNVVANLTPSEYNEFRCSVIDIVLATDMSYHFQQLKLLKNAINQPETLSMLQLLCIVIHLADISHPAKPWHIHSQWTNRLFEEFFIQGDRETELHLAISPLCDRHNTMVAESQIGFIDFIISPTVSLLFDAIPVAIRIRLEDLGSDDKKMAGCTNENSKLMDEITFLLMKNKARWEEESKNN